MLQLKNIRKSYTTGTFTQKALDDVSISFRDNEFVAILGPSGSGKTTLLNIVGGLDHYDSGDLVIEGVSTKEYKDRDWDTYRNNRIGFVFQSYNLIPHQTVLANVELALTLSGVSREERRKRAVEALERVGLGEHIDKKPAQMSGGQMQRVAIARALINDPEILLADEPTGALDSKTSVQIMDLLTEIADDRLVIMVTHNPELAEQYATRIVNLADGVIRSDTDPYEPTAEEVLAANSKPVRHTRMSFLTALSLSANNLMTKKGRTIMTAIAGSIGIIGIAAILALANGVNNYIKTVEEETLSVYPLQIMSSGFDFTSMLVGMGGGDDEGDSEGSAAPTAASAASAFAAEPESGKVGEYQMMTRMFASFGNNDLAALKSYFDSGKSGIEEQVSSIYYEYAVTPQVFDADTSKGVRQINPDRSFTSLGIGSGSSANSLVSMSMSTDMFSEMMENDVVADQYDVVAGHWPEKENELVLVLSRTGRISDFLSYVLGLRDKAQLDEMVKQFTNEEEVQAPTDELDISYDDILGMKFKLVSSTDFYKYDGEYNVWVDKTDDEAYMKDLVENAEDLVIAGIVQPKPEANATALTMGVYYTPALTRHIVDVAANSQIVKDQIADPKRDVFSGKLFDEMEGDEDNSFDMSSLFTVDDNALSAAFTFDASAFDTSGLDLSSVDLSKMDMSKMDMSKLDLSKMDLSKMDLSNFDFKNFDMSKVDMSKVDLSNIDLSGIDMSSVMDPSAIDFSNIDLSSAFDPSTLDLSNIDMSNIDLSNIDLSNVDFASMIDPSTLDFSNIDLSNVDFSQVDLSKVDFSNVDWASLDLPEPDLSGIDFSQVEVPQMTSEELSALFPELTPEALQTVLSSATITFTDGGAELGAIAGEVAAGYVPWRTQHPTGNVQDYLQTLDVQKYMSRIVAVVDMESLQSQLNSGIAAQLGTTPEGLGAEISNRISKYYMEAMATSLQSQLAQVMRDYVAQVAPVIVSKVVMPAVADVMGEYMQQAVGEAVQKAMGEAMQQAMSQAMNGAMREALGQAIGQAVQQAVTEQLQQAVGEAMQKSMGEAVQKAMGEAMQKAMGEAMQQAMSQAFQQVLPSVMGQVFSQVAPTMMTEIMKQVVPTIVTGVLGEVIPELMGQYTKAIGDALSQMLGTSMSQFTSAMSNAMGFDQDAFANAFQFNMDPDELSELMMSMMRVEEHSYDNNLKKLGYADFNKPSEISIFPRDFDSKEKVIQILDDYNELMRSTDEDKVISYTDIVGTLMESVTDIVNMISYVLIAFVAISLIVSSIMIGVITYISVLERKKEIGILRSIGASKGDISRVFNAETVIEGLISGLLGVGVTALGCIPANIIVYNMFDVPNVALLPPSAAAILVGISVLLTFVAGLIPSGSASRKDPVEALRSE